MDNVARCEGIPSQKAAGAIGSGFPLLLPDRIVPAAERAGTAHHISEPEKKGFRSASPVQDRFAAVFRSRLSAAASALFSHSSAQVQRSRVPLSTAGRITSLEIYQVQADLFRVLTIYFSVNDTQHDFAGRAYVRVV